jgi:hypothetical protein
MYRILIVLLFIFALATISFGVYRLVFNKTSTNTQSSINPLQSSGIAQVSYKNDLISQQRIKLYMPNDKFKISISEFIKNPSKFSLIYDTPKGKYEYGFIFEKDSITINIGIDKQLLSDKSFEVILTRLMISLSVQKNEKNLMEGSEQDQIIREDHIKYLERVANDTNIQSYALVDIR